MTFLELAPAKRTWGPVVFNLVAILAEAYARLAAIPHFEK